MRVTIEMYSGRENPFHNLSDKDQEINDIISSLPETTAIDEDDTPRLGFRGIVIDQLGIWDKVVVRKEMVKLQNGYQTKYLLDQELKLTGFLLSLFPEQKVI